MVKKKLQRYHLPDSMPICNAFNGLRITWFLFLDLSVVEDSGRQAAAMPHIILDCEVKGCLGEEPFELVPDTVPDSGDTRWASDSMFGINTSTEYTEGCRRTYPDMHVNHNTVKCGSNKCGYNKGQLKARPLSGERRQRRVIGNSSSEDAYDQILDEIGMRNNFLSKAVRTSDAIVGWDSWEEKKAKDGTTSEVLDIDQNGRNWLSKYAYECRKHTNPSGVTETQSGSFSGNISITGIISSYFSDIDEVDSRDVYSVKCRGVDNTKELGESCLKRRSASNKVVSLNIGGSSLEQSENKLEDLKKMKITRSKMVVSKQQAMCLENGRANLPIPLPIGNYRTHKDDHVKLLEDNATDYAKVAGHLIKSIPGTLSSSFQRHIEISRKPGRSEVGKRLLIAASKFGLSSRKNRSPISVLIAERGKPSIANSTSLVKNIMFDISDVDD
uniref:Structural maintenance of chromosomes protein 6 n=2 Tax=Anthurium amnicola TaxID=1678845 RepID=A0A1D1ZLH9_9ARAE